MIQPSTLYFIITILLIMVLLYRLVIQLKEYINISVPIQKEMTKCLLISINITLIIMLILILPVFIYK